MSEEKDHVHPQRWDQRWRMSSIADNGGDGGLRAICVYRILRCFYSKLFSLFASLSHLPLQASRVVCLHTHTHTHSHTHSHVCSEALGATCDTGDDSAVHHGRHSCQDQFSVNIDE